MRRPLRPSRRLNGEWTFVDFLKLCNCLNDEILLSRSQSRVHRQRENLRGYFLGYREIAILEAHRTIWFLEVDGHRIVDAGSDARFGQVLL